MTERRRINDDPLTPASGADYVVIVEKLLADLRAAQGRLLRAWDQRTNLRFGFDGRSFDPKRELPENHPDVVAAREAIELARLAWRDAHDSLAKAFAAGLQLRCGVLNWKSRAIDVCTLPAAHAGPHTFEPGGAR